MRQDVKELADAMEAGWKLCPHMVSHSFFTSKDNSNQTPEAPTACCPRGHAGLGKYGSADKHTLFPVLFSQRVQFPSYSIDCLAYAINELADKGWTTPQVVAWLRSHLND